MKIIAGVEAVIPVTTDVATVGTVETAVAMTPAVRKVEVDQDWDSGAPPRGRVRKTRRRRQCHGQGKTGNK